MLQPQEIEVWYLLPAIRRELARAITDIHGKSQKEAARILDLSEPAISQYKKSKRAKEVRFTENTMKYIEKAAARIINDNSVLVKEIQDLCTASRKDMTLCKICRRKIKDLPLGCRICLEREK